MLTYAVQVRNNGTVYENQAKHVHVHWSTTAVPPHSVYMYSKTDMVVCVCVCVCDSLQGFLSSQCSCS